MSLLALFFRTVSKVEVAKFKDDRKGAFATLSIFRFATGGGGVATPDDSDDGVPPVPDISQFPGFSRPENAKEHLESLILDGPPTEPVDVGI